jgi:ribonuclease Z
VPLPGRALASALLRVGGRMVLIDCGEGTQVAMRAPGWGFGGLESILLTHVHADHVAGLPGLLLTLGLAGRTARLDVYGARWTTEVMQALRVLVPHLPYEVHVHELAGGESFEAAGLVVRTIALEHRAPCLGYRLDLPRRRRFLPEQAEARAIPKPLWRRLQDGEPVEWQGGRATPDEVLGPPRPGIAVAYATDTRPVEGLAAFARGVDLLICEATYLLPGDEARAAEHDHLHLVETCRIAAEAGARRLWLTHFSQAVPDSSAVAELVHELCPVAEIGRDGMTTVLRFQDEDGPSLRPEPQPGR